MIRRIMLLAVITAFAASAWAAGVQEPLKIAMELHDAGKVAEAITEYSKVIKANPKLAEAYFNRGNA